jgi:hypothetical protein
MGSSGIPVKKNSPQRRRVHREFVQAMIFTQFSLRPPRLGGEISQYCFTQMPEEPKNKPPLVSAIPLNS